MPLAPERMSLLTAVREPGTVGHARPVGVDLFAGAGGLGLGFEAAGFDIAAAVEIDPIHCATHAFNFPRSAVLCRSVVDVDAGDIRRAAGTGNRDIAVVFGGAPCQGFSLIGKRALDDPRNALVRHFVRLVLELRPACFAFERVRKSTDRGATPMNARWHDIISTRIQLWLKSLSSLGAPASRRHARGARNEDAGETPAHPGKKPVRFLHTLFRGNDESLYCVSISSHALSRA